MTSQAAPQVSVVIPVFSGADTIQRALDSVRAQTFTDLEIIVVDDASTDQTATIVAQSDINNLTLIRHPTNRGAAAARNSGIRAARGRWVAFLDADDSWKPEKLAVQVSAMEQVDQNVAACSTGYDVHKDGRARTVSIIMRPGQFRDEILFGCHISPGSTLMVERRTFDELGLFDEELRRLEDWDWLLRFAQRHEIRCIPDPLADVFMPSGRPSFSAKEADYVLDAIRRIGEKHLLHAPSSINARKLQSSLLVQTASLLHRRHQPAKAASYVMRSLFVYPRRNPAFFGMLWRSCQAVLRGWHKSLFARLGR